MVFLPLGFSPHQINAPQLYYPPKSVPSFFSFSARSLFLSLSRLSSPPLLLSRLLPPLADVSVLEVVDKEVGGTDQSKKDVTKGRKEGRTMTAEVGNWSVAAK